MITAAITAAVGALLALVGVKPGAYLVGVAIAVKIVIVVLTLIFGARWFKRRGGATTAAAPADGGQPEAKGSATGRPASNASDASDA